METASTEKYWIPFDVALGVQANKITLWSTYKTTCFSTNQRGKKLITKLKEKEKITQGTLEHTYPMKKAREWERERKKVSINLIYFPRCCWLLCGAF